MSIIPKCKSEKKNCLEENIEILRYERRYPKQHTKSTKHEQTSFDKLDFVKIKNL